MAARGKGTDLFFGNTRSEGGKQEEKRTDLFSARERKIGIGDRSEWHFLKL